VARKILVFDEDENVRHLLKLELSDKGYKVVLASNANRSLDILKENNIDLVILDIKMKGMDGIETLQKILGLQKELPVIIHSAYSHFKKKVKTWGATDYVLKSSNTDLLLETIGRHLNLTIKSSGNKRFAR
jgi:DNA-binding NtrC family response regulator